MFVCTVWTDGLILHLRTTFKHLRIVSRSLHLSSSSFMMTEFLTGELLSGDWFPQLLRSGSIQYNKIE